MSLRAYVQHPAMECKLGYKDNEGTETRFIENLTTLFRLGRKSEV